MMQLISLIIIMTSVFSASESYSIAKAGLDLGQAASEVEGAYRFVNPDKGFFTKGPAAGDQGQCLIIWPIC
jgi:hypothetical protein